jgi:replicative DNA helicase
VLTALADVPPTVPRLAGLFRVALARVHVSYRNHRALAGPVAEASVLRTLDIVGPDVIGDWTEGEAVLQSLLTNRQAVQEAAATVLNLEGLLAE